MIIKEDDNYFKDSVLVFRKLRFDLIGTKVCLM